MRPRLLISLVCVALVLAAASAQALRQEIVIRPRLSVNDAFRLEVVHTREDSGPTQATVTTRTPVDVRVVSLTKDGIALDWRPAESVVEVPAGAADLVRTMAAKAVGGITLRLILTADGEFVRLGNEAELLKQLQSLADLAIQGGSERLSPEEAKKTEAAVRSILSPQNLLTIASRDAQTYLSIHGLALSPGETVELKFAQPSPFGGGTIPKVFRAQLESATPDQAVITSTTTSDAAALAKMTMALLDQAGGTLSPEERAKFRFDMSEDGKYVFDRKLGLLREVTINRHTSSGPARRLERWVIRLVTDPKR